MIRGVNDMIGVGLEATDGSIGEIHDVFFDDSDWSVRYYVVDTGKWLPGRRVLLPPNVIRQTIPGHVALPVNLTQAQIERSPDVDTERPISRQAEAAMYTHYGWTPYWFPLDPAVPVVVEGNAEEREREATSGYYGGDPHLRSAKEVIGYHVAAKDGEIGHIEDFLVDDETAKIRYGVIDTVNWLPGKKVLISPQWIREVKWAESRVYVDATQEAVRNSPEYNPATPIDRDYESSLFAHYGHPGRQDGI